MFFNTIFDIFYVDNTGMDSPMFWQNVKTKLKQDKHSQAELAASCDVSIGTLQNQIARNILPNVELGTKIARALGVSVEYLVTGKETNTAQQELKALKQKLFDLSQS